MRKIVILVFAFLFIALASVANASENLEYKSFKSEISINQDLSITVAETVVVEFLIPRHGIFRYVPEKSLKVISVTDKAGTPYKYKVSGGSVKEIKIGDPDIETTGEHTYIITYLVKEEVKEYPEHFELYWNVTGDKWDSELPLPEALVESDFANITRVDCFSAVFGESSKNCTADFDKNTAIFTSRAPTGLSSDFTIVLALDKENNFIPATKLQKLKDVVLDHWYYLLTPLPFLVPLYFWFKRGRDERYASENIYYTPSDTSTRTVGIFERKFIPMVYSPIKGLTPAQVGTIIDEKVDIADVVAEITELARLGYLKIKKIPKKGIFGKNDYEFTSNWTEKDRDNLTSYQKVVLDGLFEDGSPTLLSDQKNKFYTHLKNFKDDLYENMNEKKFFDGNPEKVRQKWFGIIFLISLGVFFVVNIFGAINEDPLPVLMLIVFAVLGFFITRAMARRTPYGYALFRQTEGLKWYIDKGLWRQEIAEKKLFIDEILPLAISLGVVGKLTKDMQVLGLAPPSYVGGVSAHGFASDMGSFQSSMGSTLASSPGGKGGSGFSGGSAGGGGGGGGGGGW